MAATSFGATGSVFGFQPGAFRISTQLFEELLDGTTRIEPVADEAAVRAVHPGSGFTQLPLWIR